MKKVRAKIRKYIVRNVPVELIHEEDLYIFDRFCPINTKKYYKMLSVKLIDTDDYRYKDILFTYEKLQNLKSYAKRN